MATTALLDPIEAKQSFDNFVALVYRMFQERKITAEERYTLIKLAHDFREHQFSPSRS